MQNVVTLKQPIALLLNDGELHAAKILIGPNLSDSGDGIVLLVASFSAGIDNTVIPLNHTSAVGTCTARGSFWLCSTPASWRSSSPRWTPA
jgi:hypothetical protein